MNQQRELLPDEAFVLTFGALEFLRRHGHDPADIHTLVNEPVSDRNVMLLWNHLTGEWPRAARFVLRNRRRMGELLNERVGEALLCIIETAFGGDADE